MTLIDNAAPTVPEIERQLARIISSEIFLPIQQQARLLKFVVERALLGDEITEKFIRENLFPTPPYQLESNIARRTMDLLRNTLSEHYASEGKEDPVIITFPQSPKGKRIKFQAGAAYAPQFKYNPLHPAVLEFRVANHNLKQMSFFHSLDGMLTFEKLETLPGLEAAALLGQAETKLSFSLYDGWFCMRAESHLDSARKNAQRSIEKDPFNWRAHAVLGIVWLCLHERAEADAEFDIALDLDKHETEFYFGYIAYLMATGDYSKALQLARLKAAERIDDAFSQALLGLIYYALRDTGNAEHALKNALLLDLQCWLADFVLGALHADQGDGQIALGHFRRARTRLSGRHMIGHEVLCAARYQNPAPKKEEKEYWHEVRWMLKQVDGSEDIFQMAVSMIAGSEFFERWFPGKPRAHALQIACKYFIYSYLDFYPLTLWLHLWPFLDSIRRSTNFEEELRDFGFPDPPSS